MIAAHRRQHRLFIADDGVDRNGIEEALRTREDRHGLLFERHRRELRLLQQLGQARAAVEQLLRGSIEVRTELREGGHFAILGELELDRARHLLHRLGLGGGADARHRQTDVDRRADAREEQVGFEEDLAVGNRDHVGRDVGRHVACLRFDDRECCQRAAAIGVVHLRRALEETRVEIEHVAGIGFAARRATQQQRHWRYARLLRQIVIDDERVLAVLHPVLAHGATAVGSQVLERCRVGSRGDHDGGVLIAPSSSSVATDWATVEAF